MTKTTPEQEPIVDLRGVDAGYGSMQVLFDVSLDVAAGELFALLGTNGAGKSTLLRVLCGLLPPTSGSVHVDGVDVTGSDVVDMVERGVTLLPGGRAVFPDMTVQENLEIGAYRLRRRPADLSARIEAVLEEFPALGALCSSLAGSLSGGEQQQLALAKAFLLQPRLLCIDELSLGLAPVIVERLIESVRRLSATGTTIVLVEQSLNIASTLCDRAVFLEKGAVRFSGRTTDLLRRDDIARAVFLGRRDGAA